MIPFLSSLYILQTHTVQMHAFNITVMIIVYVMSCDLEISTHYLIYTLQVHISTYNYFNVF